MLWPAAALWLNSNINTVVFVYAFTWIFFLTSVIPSILLGKERSILLQYFICLILAFLALSAQDLLLAYGGIQIEQVFNIATFLENPILAGLYLMIPYIVMLAIDIRSRRKRRS
jgi:hypothetical protein